MAEALYCNTTTDLQSVEPNIHSYSSNRLVMGWSNTFRTNASTNVYYKGGVGHADQVYFNGKEGFSSHVESLDWTVARIELPLAGLDDDATAKSDASNYDNCTVYDVTYLKIGDIILIESEEMLVEDIAGDIIYLRRGFSGTTIATHAADTYIYLKYRVDNDGEWYYSKEDDMLLIYWVLDPDGATLEVGQDWENERNRVVQEASEFVRSYVARPILVRKDSASSRDYDMIIIRSTAYLACSMLIQPYNPEKAQELEWRAINPEDGSGLLDRLKAGDFVLWNEVSESKRQGKVTIVTQGGSSTGDIIDVRGKATTTWDLIRVKIITGGTITKGSASSVTYSTWVGDSTGIQTSQLYDAATVTGNYTNIGHGIQIRMSDGVYTADDAWDVEVSGSVFDNPKIKRINLTRN